VTKVEARYENPARDRFKAADVLCRWCPQKRESPCFRVQEFKFAWKRSAQACNL